MKTLAERYKRVCQDYADALNKMWETDGEWIDDDLWWFDVADCIIDITNVRLCVENNIPWETFIKWYEYDMQISYAKEIGKSVNRVNLYSWIHGFPEEHKVPEETRQEWEREYWKKELNKY